MGVLGKIIKWAMIFSFSIAFVIVAGVIYLVFWKTSGINIESDPWLPKSAKSITYMKRPFVVQYEFTVPEKDFLDWIDENKFENQGYRQPDGTFAPLIRTVPRSGLIGEGNVVIQFEEGYYWGTLDIDGGGYQIGFDRGSSRAYYSWTAR